MRTNFKSALLALAILVPASGAWTVANEQLVLQPQSRLWIDGTSTIRSFTCKAGEVNAGERTGFVEEVVGQVVGQEDGGGSRLEVAHQFDDLEAAELGHLGVEDGHVDGGGFDYLEGFAAGADGEGVDALGL